MNKFILSENIAKPYHKIFVDDIHSDIAATSGRAGAKSSGMLGINAIYTAINIPCGQIIMRKFHNKLRKTVYQECIRAINRMGLSTINHFICTVSPMKITYKANGSTIYFSGNDNIDDTKGIIDPLFPIKKVYIDELTEFFEKGDGEDELEQIKATFIRGNNNIFQTIYLFNPPKNSKAPVMDWLNKMKIRSNFIHVHADYRDLPEEWLGKALIDSANLMKEYDERMYRWVWLGECIGLDDVIYYMFNESVHIQEPTDEQLKRLKLISIGCDYGQLNPTTFEAFGFDYKDKCIRGIDEYYHCGREEGQKTPNEYAEEFVYFVDSIRKVTGYKGVIFVLIDPSASGLKESIRRICKNIAFLETDNSVNLGIDRVKSMMSYRLLFYSNKQKNLTEEKSLYEWEEKSIERGEEKPKKLNDHSCDAERYVICSLWRYIVQMLPFIASKGDDE